MISPSNSQIPDELLSAYIDDAVTAQERLLVEAAMQDDPEVAWRLTTLRQTVHLLNQLPAVPLPRSFVLDHGMVAEKLESASNRVTPTVAAPRPQAKPVKPSQRDTGSFWQRWAEFWQGGNLLLRNAATVTFALFLILVGGDLLLAPKNFAPSASVGGLPTEAPRELALAPTATNATSDTATRPLTVTEPATPTPEPAVKVTVPPVSNPEGGQESVTARKIEPDVDPPREDQGSPFEELNPQPVGVGGGGEGTAQFQAEQLGGRGPPAPAEVANDAGTMKSMTSANTETITGSGAASETVVVSSTHALPTVEMTVTMTPTAASVVAITETLVITNTVGTVDKAQTTNSQRARAKSLPTEEQNRLRNLQFAQIVLILATFLLGLLWWRSHVVIP